MLSNHHFNGETSQSMTNFSSVTGKSPERNITLPHSSLLIVITCLPKSIFACFAINWIGKANTIRRFSVIPRYREALGEEFRFLHFLVTCTLFHYAPGGLIVRILVEQCILGRCSVKVTGGFVPRTNSNKIRATMVFKIQPNWFKCCYSHIMHE